jgi:hypothetical protein
MDDGYFPGPDVWATGRPVPTSGITQPAVAGFALKRLYDRATDRADAETRARALLPKVAAWHRWFYATRDPKGEGLVAILHPWESGRDNSVDWDAPFARVPTDGIAPYTRRDTQHANPAHRPTKEQYDRYLWLVEHFRALGWDTAKLHDASPFQVVDPGFNAILIRACMDLAELADQLGEAAIAQENRAFAARGLAAMERLWSEEHGQYLCHDRVAGSLIDSASIGGLLAAFAAIPPARAERIAATIPEVCEDLRAGLAVVPRLLADERAGKPGAQQELELIQNLDSGLCSVEPRVIFRVICGHTAPRYTGSYRRRSSDPPGEHDCPRTKSKGGPHHRGLDMPDRARLPR